MSRPLIRNVNTCSTCRYWFEMAGYTDADGVAVAACRRRAPVHTASQLPLPSGIWPTTSFDSWCGEWRRAA
jgi:hypothetical protein